MRSSKTILDFVNDQIVLLEIQKRESEEQIEAYKLSHAESFWDDEKIADVEFSQTQLGALVAFQKTRELILSPPSQNLETK